MTSFEQYWKNNPTTQNLLGASSVTSTESVDDAGIVLTSAQQSLLPSNWHTYQAWANAAPWTSWSDGGGGSGKKYHNKHHWFQTINMATVAGSQGEFEFVETSLEPQVILLDKHGWEIMRKPLSQTDELRKYDSPMVKEYHWYPTATKAAGYHKYTVDVDNPGIQVYYSYEDGGKTKWAPLNETYTHTSTTLADSPYDHINSTEHSGWEEQPASVKTDFYVTYDVDETYERLYTGAARKENVKPAAFLVQLGDNYAKIDGTSLGIETTLPDPITENMQWYLRTNFDIDREMGYLYAGQTGAQDDALPKDDTEAAYFSAGQNGFDPYNVQIQSVENNFYYFTTPATDSQLTGGSWEGTSTDLTLENLSFDHQHPEGYDQTTLNITNATFIVVKDAGGRWLLMPRFDNTKASPKFIHYGDELSSLNGQYILAADFDFTKKSDGTSFNFQSLGSGSAPFTGSIDGGGHTFTWLSVPLLAYADGAIVKNLILDNVRISNAEDVPNVGAIAANATGKTRIYNCGVLASESTIAKGADGYDKITSCSSTVGGSGYVGGLVGLLDGEARVINCYSYADITSGTEVGGIVGHNNVATASNNLKTMVFACMFYGNIADACGNKAPIYNGTVISNVDNGVGNFNYFRSDAPWAQDQDNIDTPNSALMAEDRFLQRFEFFRLLLNSQRELAAWWVTGEMGRKDEMKKWVLETADRTIDKPMPYPVLKAQDQYPSIINYDAEHATTTTERNKGGKLGTLTVNIQMGNGKVFGAPAGAEIKTTPLTLNITDKDPDHFNFNYNKVQLPYYNDVGTKNYSKAGGTDNTSRVVTGWKIVSITGGNPGTFTAADEWGGYNFADRHCTDKDLYSVSGRIFNQGAYWDVPEGVTAITIEPYWAKAAYVADAYPDVVYNQGMTSSKDVPNVGNGQKYTNGGIYPIAGENQTVYTSIANASNALSATSNTVYDYAVVLVGNVHQYTGKDAVIGGDKKYTVTTIDLDHDNEPDYSFMMRDDGRGVIHPLRWDFLNIVGLGMAQKSTGAKGSYNLGILIPKGWFESTNTSLFRVTQFEYEHSSKAATDALIVQGGVMEQWVSNNQKGTSNKIPYIHVGGNVWFKEFHTGCHQDKSIATLHSPISVTGGDYDEFYLTGLYRGDVTSKGDNAECYINGGRFGIVCGAGMEGIGNNNGANNTGNISWLIQNADIREFYAGGLNAAKPVTGNLSTTITNSYVGIFCGGPKFGDMSAGKTVHTTATGCTFGTYFGAGYGGNSYSRLAPKNHNSITNFPHNDKDAGNHASWNAWLAAYYKQDYSSEYGGVSTQYTYQFLPMSDNNTNVARILVDYVKFSLATTRDVTSDLTGCIVTGNFYGGGSLGKVDGNVTSTLTDCTLNGDAFGAGFSGSLPEVEVDSIGFRVEPYYYDKFGTYRKGVKGVTTTYTWSHRDVVNNTASAIDKTNHILYTPEDLTTLGTVAGTATLNIEGTTTVAGNVYGGGESSDVTDKKGEKEAAVVVNVNSGTISHDVYGGGKGETTTVSGNITVNIGAKSGEAPSVTYTGNGTVNGDVYGGSALGNVNATKEAGYDYETDPNANIAATAGKATLVNIYGGTVNGNVFGGGRGALAVGTSGNPGYKPAIDARNFTNTAITMEGGTVNTAVYGGSNINGVLKGSSTVTIIGGTVGTAPTLEKPTITNVVFGGGFGEPTLVNGDVTVNIGTSGLESSGAILNGNIYGGGALGNVNTSKPASELVFDPSKKVNVNLYKGTIHGNVYGGGLGQQAKDAVLYENVTEYNTAKGTSLDAAAFAALSDAEKTKTEAESAVEAYVGGDVKVLLDGATLTYSVPNPKTGQVFGGNNLNGTPKGHILVHVKRTVPVEGQTYDVAAVYGGGNEADYNPTNDDYAEVVIEGCSVTSIQEVYGGGNAAAVPATEVWVLAAKKIENLFGGGNGVLGADHAAHVGFHRNDDLTKSDYANGSGKTFVNLVGGTIQNVFGGSNSNGDIREGANILMPKQSDYAGTAVLNSPESCTLNVEHIYGGGKNADMSGGTNIVLGCMPDEWIGEIYAGAQNADVTGDVSLTITSGKFYRVFGGNKDGGMLKGSIKVNIEETGECDVPIVIGELYGGGNLAGYSIYGYKNTGTIEAPVWVPRTKAEYNTWYASLSEEDKAKPENQPYDNPQLNVRAFTSIGKIFGGGFQALMIADPQVDIDVVKGSHAATARAEETIENVPIKKKNESTGEIEDATITLHFPAHEENKIGAIEHVFGGGNLAEVIGDATVNIGTETTAVFITEPKHLGTKGTDYTERGDGKFEATVEGAIITGSVYGGGNEANIDGNTQVNICAKWNEDNTKYQRVAPGTAGVSIAQDVFGAGKGIDTDATTALVSGNTTIVMMDGEVKQSVYGGGQLSQVGHDTNILIGGGTIGKNKEGDIYYGGATWGNVYGAGLGSESGVGFGLVKGNTNITIQNTMDGETLVSSPTIYHNIYGGGALASVGDFTFDGTTGLPNGLNPENTNTGKATLIISGGTIGIDGHENGMVFGSSRGLIDAPKTIYDKLAWVYDTDVEIGAEGAATGPTLHGSLYGGGENGHVLNDASVTMIIGTVGNPAEFYAYRGNVYGAGCGTDMYYSSTIPDGHTVHDGAGDKYNPLAGFVGHNASVTINGGNVANNVYGAGSMGKVGGSTSVIINTNGAIGVEGAPEGGNVYGAARGELDLTGKIPDGYQADDFSSVTSSSVTLTKGTVRGSLYGGGKAGVVHGPVTVNLNGGTVEHDAYGGGALAKANTQYHATEHPDYITTVNLGNSTQGSNIVGNLYGGGLGQLAADAVLYADETEYNAAKGTSLDAAAFAALSVAEKTKTPAKTNVEADVKGPITVTVTKGLATNVFGCNNVNGSPQSTVTVNINGTDAPDDVTRPLPIRNVYGGGNMAAYTYTDSSHPQNLQVNITGGTMDNVFGGGLSADVYGGINVNVSGGTIKNDVYGGGALANTNTGNTLEAAGNNTNYYFEVKHLKYVEDDAEKASSVVGYYEDAAGNTPTTDDKAHSGKTYYKQTILSAKAHRDVTSGTTYKTIVSLTGGVIGNAYGGGLGQLTAGGATTGEGAVQAMVYGDVDVTVNGAAFTAVVEPSAKNAPVTGRVFGCNNINGTPKGSVTVRVNSTRRIDGGNHTLGDFEIQGVYGGGNLSDYAPETYDKDTEFGQRSRVIIDGCEETSISKVYGGGNAAVVPYTDVTIEGAFEIGYVFGGGNGGDMIYKNGTWIDNTGADVPGYTHVLLKGGTIGQAFGGSDSRGSVGGSEILQETGGSCPLRLVNLYGAGNGEEASSVGDITVDVSGCGEYSEIQNVFGGSYKANITGSVTLNIKSGIFTSVYGGNDRMGSIGGNITINIEETDNCDKPIIIQNLYGGCYQTPYPGANARTYKGSGDVKDDANYNPFTSGKLTVNVKSATRIDKIYGGSEEGDVTGETEININMIKGSMSGHSGVTLPSYYAETGASIPGNITVAPAMGWIEAHVYFPTPAESAAGRERSSVEGYYTKDVFTVASGTAEAEVTYYELNDGDYTPVSPTPSVGADVSSYYTKSEGEYVRVSGSAKKGYTYYKQVVQGTIADRIGTIGDVFGGGNLGKVTGNTTINIGTATSVTMNTETDNPDTDDIDERVHTVLGADITGDVFCGGNQADVTGNTNLNIGVTYNEANSRYEAVAEGTEKVKIAGDVFGGGKGIADSFRCDKGMIGVVDTNTGAPEDSDKGTHVRIGNGTIGNGTKGGNVYGGGKVGRVEFHTNVTVGYAYGATSEPEIKGNVFGAGQGVSTHGYAALVRGNTTVTVDGNAKIGKSVYGGGEIASVGRYTVAQTAEEAAAHGVEIGMPYSLANSGSGICTVTVGGDAEIGPNSMTMPTFTGHVFGGGKGVLPYEGFVEPNKPWRILPSGTTEYYSDEDSYLKYVETLALATQTDVTIGGNAFVKGSVYGGSENGIVQHDTHVLIAGGQIGCGKNTTVRHPDGVWAADYTPTAETDLECASWGYGLAASAADKFAPYDKYANEAGYDSKGGRTTGDDGHTYYGNVYGGGSGKDPYKPGKWHRKAGLVAGNTQVDITGGHILTSMYGGNEMTDMGLYSNDPDHGTPTVPVSGGKCTINMVGGTLGVPRTVARMIAHPVTCYLFGAGKGDPRTFFNTWTNVIETEVNISGTARIYGSTFGGGEDGHVITNSTTNIGGTVNIDLNGDGDTADEGETFTAQSGLKIGTTGTSYVDGNVFGGGRGYSGTALTAGSTGGNVTVNISGGTMLGSIYGGGRLASVGIGFTPATDHSYGQLHDDDNSHTYGHVTINISGENTVIGNGTTEAGTGHSVGGNVFGGSMGRITLLDKTLNPLWPKLAVVKTSEISITGGTIWNSVYGGSEYGIVRDKATVTIGGTRNSTGVVTPSGTPTIHGSVYGGGYGSDDTTPTLITAGEYATGQDYIFTPMIWTGCVSGDTEVNIAGGTVKKNVYGGGEIASVGLINCHVVEDANGDITIGTKKYRYTNLTKHADIQGTGTEEEAYGFALSWPYKFEYIPADPKSDHVGGKATVNVTGGHIGSTTWDDRTGYVFGGSKGQVAFEGITDIHKQRYIEGLCANVRETKVNVKYSTTPSDKTPSNIGAEANCIMGAVYGGGEDGHVYENAAVNITNGLIGLSVYGGGKGEGTFTGTKYVYNESTKTWTLTDNVPNMPSWTAGKVYGNTSITMSDGHVMGNVYGGGNLGSVGKGNYAGGTDDYYPAGYGETLQNAPLWTKSESFNPEATITDSNKPTSMADYFLSSGKCTISITGGTVGTLNGLYGYVYGTSNGTPTGMVFGGSRGRAAQDVGKLSPRYNYAPDFFLGYVNNTDVTIGTRNAATGPTIYGQVFGGGRDGHVRGSAKVEVNSGTIGQTYDQSEGYSDESLRDYQRYHRGNVYGSGSGLGTWNGTNHGTSSGSVTRNTTVDIYGGTIYNNVYGGGAMATVGPPKITKPDFAPENWSKCTVNIYGGTIGSGKEYESVYMSDFDKYGYGGCVYGPG